MCVFVKILVLTLHSLFRCGILSGEKVCGTKPRETGEAGKSLHTPGALIFLKRFHS